MIQMLKSEDFSIDTTEYIKIPTIANYYGKTKSKKGFNLYN